MPEWLRQFLLAQSQQPSGVSGGLDGFDQTPTPRPSTPVQLPPPEDLPRIVGDEARALLSNTPGARGLDYLQRQAQAETDAQPTSLEAPAAGDLRPERVIPQPFNPIDTRGALQAPPEAPRGAGRQDPNDPRIDYEEEIHLPLTPEEQQAQAELRQREQADFLDRAMVNLEMGEGAEEELRGFADIHGRDPQRAEEMLRSMQERRNAVLVQLDDTIRSAARANVDPTRFFTDRGAATSFGAAISVAAGAAASILSGGPNHALQIIDRAVERDIRAQEFNIQNRHNVAGLQAGLLGQLRQAFGDDVAAMDTLRAMRWANVQSRLQAMMARTANTVARQQMATLMETAQQRATMSAYAAQDGLVSRTVRGQLRDTRDDMAANERRAAAQQAARIQSLPRELVQTLNGMSAEERAQVFAGQQTRAQRPAGGITRADVAGRPPAQRQPVPGAAVSPEASAQIAQLERVIQEAVVPEVADAARAALERIRGAGEVAATTAEQTRAGVQQARENDPGEGMVFARNGFAPDAPPVRVPRNSRAAVEGVLHAGNHIALDEGVFFTTPSGPNWEAGEDVNDRTVQNASAVRNAFVDAYRSSRETQVAMRDLADRIQGTGSYPSRLQAFSDAERTQLNQEITNVQQQYVAAVANFLQTGVIGSEENRRLSGTFGVPPIPEQVMDQIEALFSTEGSVEAIAERMRTSSEVLNPIIRSAANRRGIIYNLHANRTAGDERARAAEAEGVGR